MRKSMKNSRQDSHRNISLSEVHETVVVPSRGTAWRKWLAITGPALMVSVGYMDPGNWATDLAGGSRYNYTLIWVLLMSNMKDTIQPSTFHSMCWLRSLSRRVIWLRSLVPPLHCSYSSVCHLFMASS